MSDIFGKEFNLQSDVEGIEIIYSEEVNAGQVPDIKNFNTSVAYTWAVETDLRAHDMIVRTSDSNIVYSYAGEFCKDNGLQLLGVSSQHGTCLMRFYRKVDWPCDEHPELLHGAALGQYHCPFCGEMQMAGMLHLPKDLDTDSV